MEQDTSLADMEYHEPTTSKRRVTTEVNYEKKKKPAKPKKPPKMTPSKIIYNLPESQRKKDPVLINCTSKSAEEWSTGLSPFYLGPVTLWDGMIAENVENAWQYAKVYTEHLDAEGNPSEKWWSWAKDGWSNKNPVRFPMGRGAKPEYSYWKGEKLGYVDARINIYCPLYASTVAVTPAFQKLASIYKETEGNIALFDYDGYDFHKYGMSLEDVLYEEKKKMGHAFVLLMLLRGTKYWESPNATKLAATHRYKSKHSQ